MREVDSAGCSCFECLNFEYLRVDHSGFDYSGVVHSNRQPELNSNHTATAATHNHRFELVFVPA